MNLNRLTTKENWSRIGSKADLARLRTRTLPMAVLWLVVLHFPLGKPCPSSGVRSHARRKHH
jgi:hypothetical protein